MSFTEKANKLSILSDIVSYNNKRKGDWRVVEEVCYYYKDGKLFFAEDIYSFVKDNGVPDKLQSIEEMGALGKAYFIDSNKLTSFLNN